MTIQMNASIEFLKKTTYSYHVNTTSNRKNRGKTCATAKGRSTNYF